MKSNPELWRRLASVSFDDLDAEFPFTARLARDNGWSQAFAARVVEEYRRFAYLAMTTGREVTPSDEVDQAWHLHLTYTRHYWGEFTEALGAPLHHGPTRGGDAERRRYADNYNATRTAYALEFGDAPPADIWPSAAVRFGRALHMRRVDAGAHLLVSKRLAQRGLAIAGAALACVATGVGAAASARADADSGGIDRIMGWIDAHPEKALAIGAVVFIIAALSISASRASAAKKSSGSGCGGAGGAGCSSGKGEGGGDSGCGGCGG